MHIRKMQQVRQCTYKATLRHIHVTIVPAESNKYRETQKKRELLKNPTEIEEMQQKKFIDRN